MRFFPQFRQDPGFKTAFWLLSSVMLVSLALRLIQGNLLQGDAESYFSVAELLKNGSYFLPAQNADAAVALTLRPFLYPMLLIFPGLSHPVTVLILQTLLGCYNLYLMLSLLRLWGGRPGKLLVPLVLLTPSIFIYTHLVMTEGLVMTLVLLLARTLTGGFSKKKVMQVQVILVALVFLKPVFFPFTLVSLVFFIIYFIRTRQFHWIIFLPLALSLGYMGFNRYRTGYFHFSSIQNVNLVDYNLNLFLIRKNGADAARAWRSEVYAKANRLASFKERQESVAASAKAVIRDNFVAYSVFHFSGALRGAVDPGRADLTLLAPPGKPQQGLLFGISTQGYTGAFTQWVRSGNLWQLLILVPVFIAGLLKWTFLFFQLRRRKKMFGFASAYLILFTGFYILITGPVNASRYMMPLQGVLIVAAITGWQNRRMRPENPSPEIH